MTSYKRILNTYNFTFTNAGDVRGDAGVRETFNFKMPILPPLPNNESKTGIFRILLLRPFQWWVTRPYLWPGSPAIYGNKITPLSLLN